MAAVPRSPRGVLASVPGCPHVYDLLKQRGIPVRAKVDIDSNGGRLLISPALDYSIGRPVRSRRRPHPGRETFRRISRPNEPGVAGSGAPSRGSRSSGGLDPERARIPSRQRTPSSPPTGRIRSEGCAGPLSASPHHCRQRSCPLSGRVRGCGLSSPWTRPCSSRGAPGLLGIPAERSFVGGWVVFAEEARAGVIG